MRHSRPRTLVTATLAATLAAGLAASLVGCSSPSAEAGGSKASDGERLRVVATTTQLADFTKEIGGDDIELTGLLKPGASAHHFDPSPADLLALGRADVLVVNGAGLETFVSNAVEASGFHGKTVTAADGLDQATLKAITAEGAAEAGGAETHDHAHESTDAHDHGSATEEAAHAHADGDDDDHDHGDLNPHIWTSPRNAEGMVSEVAKGLAQADPAHKADYQRRADAYLLKLKGLDEWITTQMDRVPKAERIMVTGHDSLRYYLHDYGIAFAGSILPSFEDNAEPSAADVDRLVATIKERKVRAVFVESSMSPGLARTIAKEAGVKVVDAESLYTDSLGPAGSSSAQYLGATVHNTQTILEAWGEKPGPLPENLK